MLTLKLKSARGRVDDGEGAYTENSCVRRSHQGTVGEVVQV